MNEMIADLADAQARGDAEAESVAIKRYLDSRRVKMTPTIRFYSKLVFGLSDCWYWGGARNRLGYGLLPLLGESKAHRVSWVLHNGPIPDGLGVLHKCDVRSCVNPNHLFLGTHQDNMRDMVAKGRHVSHPRFGEDNPMSKLTRQQVEEIRKIYKKGAVSMKRLAEMYGVTTMTIQRAVTRQTWRK